MTRAIAIGGSAGSYKLIVQIISALKAPFEMPLFVCLHRLRTARTGFAETLRIKSHVKIVEPADKEIIRLNYVYVAPANYHMLISRDGLINLSVEEEICHSRPSIDITFASASEVYKERMMAVILSGANDDGTNGMRRVKENGGITIAQNPKECDVSVMPLSCIQNNCITRIESTGEIIKSIQNFILSK